MEYKTIPLEIKSLEEDGTFEGFANVYDVVDLGNDLVEKGAFAKTILERPKIAIKMEHAELIGGGTLEDTDHGPFLKGKLTLGVQRAREAYELLKDGVLGYLSIGWQPIKATKSGNVRRVTEGRIFEVSMTAIPMNEFSAITAFKEGRRISRASREKLESAMGVIQSLLGDDAGADPDLEQDAATTQPEVADKPAEESTDNTAALKALQGLIETIKQRN
jgi:hypothetical protein